jgi:hypothetical protein
VVKLHVGISEKSGANFPWESVCREAGFEGYCTYLVFAHFSVST